MNKFFGAGFPLDELIIIVGFNDQIASVDGLIAVNNLRHITQRRATRLDKIIRSIIQIRVDIRRHGFLLTVKNEPGLFIGRNAEADDHTVHRRRLVRIVLIVRPFESPTRKINVDRLEKFLPHRRHLLALDDRVGRHERRPRLIVTHELSGFVIPARDIIHFFIVEPRRRYQIVFLFGRL